MKIGIVGAGTIVPDFITASAKIDGMELIAIAGLPADKQRMEDLAKQGHIQTLYFDYEEMLQNADVEVVYVAVPNSLHYQFTKLALTYNKSVILEKPFASNYKQAQVLVDLCKETGLYLFEAISNQYFPNYDKMKELLPELGDVKIVQLNYSQYSRRYDLFKAGTILPVFNPKMAGGALMDLNVYNIHFIVGLFGAPSSISYHANIEKGIDTSGVLTLDYPSFKCVAVAAKDCAAPTSINIQGDAGFIHSDFPANVLNTFTFAKNSGESIEYTLNEESARLYYELKYFCDVFTAGDITAMERGLAHSLTVMKILDEARIQVGVEVEF